MRCLKGLVISLVIAVSAIHAQDDPLWMRYPAISPDGSTIVFGYKGNLYRVSTSGGEARPLTLYDGHDYMPVWSPDGSSIAFASDRFGNFDVYLLPAAGGAATRLTFHSASDYPSDFSADGQNVIFTSSRTDDVANPAFPSGALPELYSVPVVGGRVTQVLTIPAEYAQYDGSGSRLLYQDRKGYENEWRKHHESSVTRDIWIHDLGEGAFRRVSTYVGEDRNPVFTPDETGMYYLSGENGTINVFRSSFAEPRTSEQITFFENHPVRFLTISRDGTLCYGYSGEIYTQSPDGQPSRVSISVLMDAQHRADETVSITSGATEMALSPSGKEVAFVYRGEVFVTSLETNVTKQVTQTPEQERSINFSPDGKSILYAGERDGSWNIYRTAIAREAERYFFNATILDEQPVLVSEAETFQPAYSPDGKEVAYLEDRTTLKVISLESGDTRTILEGDRNFSYADGDQHYQWSPDGKWFLVEFLLPNYWMTEVGLVSAEGGGEVVNLTRSGYPDSRPKWMMDGKMMLWFSSRDGLKSQANTGSTQADAYAMFFTQDGYERFRLTKEEYELLKEDEKEEEEEGEGAEEEEEGEEEDALEPIVIELEGIEDRKARLSIHSSRLSDAVVTPDGEKLIYLSRFEKGYDLWVTEIRTRETKVLAKLGGGGGQLELDKDGKNVFLLSGGKISKFGVGDGKRTNISFSGEMVLNASAEREYMFEHVWRQVREKFYDPDLHGVDWEFMKTEYSRFLPDINNNYDFAELLSEMLGELNASHTGAGYRPSSENADATASLGAFYDRAHTGPGLKIAEIMAKGPLVQAGTRIKAGVVVEQIDGQEIAPATNYFRLLNRKAGKKIRLSLYDPEANERWEETVKPISRSAESQLLYERWVETRRNLTHELSGGRIGYVHVRSMSDGSYRTVHEEVLGEQVTREGLVVDTRFNGGGDLVNDLSAFLSGVRYMDFVARTGQVVGFEPQRDWTKPSIVVTSEGNYSDAHCFPYAYQDLDIGQVVGMPVAGTCTFVWWEGLQDRTLVFGIPNMAVNVDGGPLENRQLEPDVLVENEPGALIAGRDQQLERAVVELLRILGG